MCWCLGIPLDILQRINDPFKSRASLAVQPYSPLHSPFLNLNHLPNTRLTSTVLPLHAASSPSSPVRLTFPFSIGSLSPQMSCGLSSPSRRPSAPSTFASRTTTFRRVLHPASTKVAKLLPRPCALHSLVSRCSATSPYTTINGLVLPDISSFGFVSGGPLTVSVAGNAAR
jgi:hypothetical protein